jgi:hypothetical protein
MRARHARRWIAAGALAACAGARAVDGDAARFPQPDRIRYDRRALMLHGRDTLIFCAPFNYTRTPAPLWRGRFERLRDAGFNTIETDVPWNTHERAAPATPGEYRHMDLAPLAEWLRMAHDEFGFHTILHIGPAVAGAEGGGLPSWLHALAPDDPETPFLRSTHPLYLDWCRHWLTAVCRVIAPEQITRTSAEHPGVILVQLEHKVDALPDPADRAVMLRALYEIVRENGVDVPVVTDESALALRAALHDAPGVFDLSPDEPRPDAPRAATISLDGGGESADDTPPVSRLTDRLIEALRTNATILRIRPAAKSGIPWEAVTAMGRYISDHGSRLARDGLADDEHELLLRLASNAPPSSGHGMVPLFEIDRLFVRRENGDEAEFAPLPDPRGDAGAPRFTLYRAELPPPEEKAAPWTSLRVTMRGGADAVLAQAGGRMLQQLEGNGVDRVARFALPEPPAKKTLRVLFLHDDAGGHDGMTLRRGPGLRKLHVEAEDGHVQALPLEWTADLAGVQARWDAPRMPEPERWERRTPGAAEQEPDAAPPPLAVWIRIEFELPDPETSRSCVARIAARGAGWVHLNSRPLGRWDERTDPRLLPLPSCWLHTGAGRTNVLTLVLRPGEHGAGVDRVRIQGGAESERAPDPLW